MSEENRICQPCGRFLKVTSQSIRYYCPSCIQIRVQLAVFGIRLNKRILGLNKRVLGDLRRLYYQSRANTVGLPQTVHVGVALGGRDNDDDVLQMLPPRGHEQPHIQDVRDLFGVTTHEDEPNDQDDR